jgi:hypothetical protein
MDFGEAVLGRNLSEVQERGIHSACTPEFIPRFR